MTSLFLLLWPGLLACPADVVCVDRTECGAREVCEGGACRPVDCLTATDCPLRHFCDDATHTCESGCRSEQDCASGESCSATDEVCFADECRTSLLDCELGQNCDLATGQCVDAPACEPCTGSIEGECGSGTCVSFVSDQPNHNYCIFPCLVVGEADQCPRGLECRDLSGNGDLFCYAECPQFLAERQAGSAP